MGKACFEWAWNCCWCSRLVFLESRCQGQLAGVGYLE